MGGGRPIAAHQERGQRRRAASVARGEGGRGVDDGNPSRDMHTIPYEQLRRTELDQQYYRRLAIDGHVA